MRGAVGFNEMRDVMADNPERQAWLDSLKAGDEVAYRTNYGREWRTSKVTTRTKTGRIAVGPYAYNSDGQLRGTNGPWRIEPVTQEIRDDLRKKYLSSMLSRCNWGTLSLAALEQVYSIMRADLSSVAANAAE